jgi:hypothetical protein
LEKDRLSVNHRLTIHSWVPLGRFIFPLGCLHTCKTKGMSPRTLVLRLACTLGSPGRYKITCASILAPAFLV